VSTDPGFCHVNATSYSGIWNSITSTKAWNLFLGIWNSITSTKAWNLFLIPDSATSSCHVTASDPRVFLVPKLASHFSASPARICLLPVFRVHVPTLSRMKSKRKKKHSSQPQTCRVHFLNQILQHVNRLTPVPFQHLSFVGSSRSISVGLVNLLLLGVPTAVPDPINDSRSGVCDRNLKAKHLPSIFPTDQNQQSLSGQSEEQHNLERVGPKSNPPSQPSNFVFSSYQPVPQSSCVTVALSWWIFPTRTKLFEYSRGHAY
jgi:hypothetical protein